MHSLIEPCQRLRNEEVNGLTLTEFAQPPSLTVSKHTHEHATILFTLRGLAADQIAGNFKECDPGTVLIRPAGEPHTHHYGREGAHCLVIEVNQSKTPAIASFSTILERVEHFRVPIVDSIALRICQELRVMDSASELAIAGLFLEIMAEAVRQRFKSFTSPAQPLWLGAARDLIHENYTQHLSLSQIAAAVGVHPAHLAEVFRKHFRLTVGQYIRRMRLDHAANELLFSDKPISEISTMAGFYDQSHFSKIFKRHTGIPPAKMRAGSRTSKAHTKTLQLSKLG
jgi:AraC family transcriptional regulator